MLRTVFRRLLSTTRKNKKVGIVGVPFEKGQKKAGVGLGPARIREAGLIQELSEIGEIDIEDYGDISVTNIPEGKVENMRCLGHVSAYGKKLSETVESVLNDGRMCITLGGDHSIGIGTVYGHYKHDDDVVVLWVDAHADINTNKTSGSGSIHGMPLALLAKELADYWPHLPTMEWLIPEFSIRNLAYIGLRSVDKYERFIIEKYKIPAYTAADVQKFGIENVTEAVLRHLDPRGTKPIHVSFDIDSLDVSEAPSTGTPVRGGLTLREGLCLMERIYETGRLRAVDLVEVNPLIGNEKNVADTVEAAMAILKASVGYTVRGIPGDDIEDLPLQTVRDK